MERRAREQWVNSRILTCTNCHETVGMRIVVLRPCNHWVCQSCMLDFTFDKCNQCGKKFVTFVLFDRSDYMKKPWVCMNCQYIARAKE